MHKDTYDTAEKLLSAKRQLTSIRNSISAAGLGIDGSEIPPGYKMEFDSLTAQYCKDMIALINSKIAELDAQFGAL